MAIAVHKSLTSQNLVELIDHNNPAAKSHLKTLKIKPPGRDCLTIWGVYLPSDDLQKREVLYQIITDSMSSEDKKASLAGLPLPYNIIAGNMNAALFILISETMCTKMAPSTEVLDTSGDADHAPILAKISLTCMKFFKPGPDPPSLPREPRLKTTVPQKDLKEFKEVFAQETGASPADLLQELDSTLELAYTVKETLDQSETLEIALTSVDIGADTVERYGSLLQDILQQVLPIAQQTCQFTKGGPVSGFRLRTRCTNRKLEGLSKLRKSLHKVAMQHRDTKDAGKELCHDLRDLQTEMSKLPEQHHNSFPLPPRQNDRKSWQEYEELCLKTRKTAAKRKDNITKELKWQSSAAARQRIQQQCPTKQKQMNKQFFGEATDKKQLTCVLNKETGEMLNDPDAVLEYVQSSFQEQAKPASGCAKKGLHIKQRKQKVSLGTWCIQQS